MNVVCLVALCCIISSGYAAYRQRPEKCSNTDISNLPNVFFEDLIGRGRINIWYSHLLVNDEGFIGKDPKLIFQFEKKGQTLREYFVERSRDATMECLTFEFEDTPVRRYSPCIRSKQIVPASNDPGEEYVFAFLDKKKSVLLIYQCSAFDKQQEKCTNVEALLTTKRQSLRRGERQLFVQALTDFGAGESVSRIENQFSATNNCEDEALRRIRRRRLQRNRMNRRRKKYRY